MHENSFFAIIAPQPIDLNQMNINPKIEILILKALTKLNVTDP